MATVHKIKVGHSGAGLWPVSVDEVTKVSVSTSTVEAAARVIGVDETIAVGNGVSAVAATPVAVVVIGRLAILGAIVVVRTAADETCVAVIGRATTFVGVNAAVETGTDVGGIEVAVGGGGAVGAAKRTSRLNSAWLRQRS
jgi:hypothetical protein